VLEKELRLELRKQKNLEGKKRYYHKKLDEDELRVYQFKLTN
jgi:hypothetical protein